MKINQISPQDNNYTSLLSTIALTPKTLYFYGNWPDASASPSSDSLAPTDSRTYSRPPTVAIVGARKHTSYGREIAYQAAFTLAKSGVIIVSGLALGIDSIAHRACLDAGGTTIAVLGTPINRIYPTRHQNLAKEIVSQGGCVASEYAPDTPLKYSISFLARNRLISALADVVLVVEAGLRSGTLNTATHALEQGRELFVVPGDITRPSSAGCNRLLAQGAHPYTSPEDISSLLFPLTPSPKTSIPTGDNPLESAILQLIHKGARDGEQIIQSLNLTPSQFNQTITLLEIKSRVRSLGANLWAPGANF